MDGTNPLDLFLPPVREWFRTALGEPTPAQRQGWPAIAAGQNTLILAPTGSGKTLAAFLACLDQLWRQAPPPGVRVLYVSPLKALNNDIHRNLQVPLEGVAATARQMGIELPAIETAVRTGDTPTRERQRLIRHPPHVLITTPESLHLLLTSRARDTLRGVTHCIIDEIHALCPNKRGVFLALLLEALNARSFVRIGLSATQRPLDEVARFLGGQAHGPRSEGRPVTIIDAGMRRDLDLQVVSPVEQFGAMPEKSVWPSIYRLLREEIGRHRSTIVFANNRRTVERITAHLNDVPDAEDRLREDMSPAERHAIARAAEGSAWSGAAKGPSPSESEPAARAHHGSVALEVRQATEQAMKEGRLQAVVATASLELGIDMGAVDLVCQVESPGNVARGLQRVGRAGHLVGHVSKGRLIPKMPSDLLEQAVLAREMAAGRVEAVRCPQNCVDVLAQQVIAMVAMESWDVPELFALVRRAYPFRDLTPHVFESVLEMVSGRFGETRNSERGVRNEDSSGLLAPSSGLMALTPRISWDRVHNRLHALPGSQQLALVNGGTIPDTGQYAAYTLAGVRIGELDEEFIYERRVGDVFLLGTNAWRLERIDADRVLVAPAEGAPAMVPFWKGEQSGRSYDLGLAMGQFLREAGERLDKVDCLSWLQRDYFLDERAARNLMLYLRRQMSIAGHLPTDRKLLVEAARDPLGDWQVVLLCPLGGKINLALRFLLESHLRRRLGYHPQIMHHNDGLLIRLADTDEPLLDLFGGIEPATIESGIVEELADSALFALRFRQNAARAMLLPRGQPGKRAPLWLQRLRGRDLLQVARRHSDFPIVAETLRECLQDHLDLPRLQELLTAIRERKIEVIARRTDAPSPFAAGLLFSFTAANMYEQDRTESGRDAAPLDRQLLEQLIAPESAGHLMDPRAIQQVERRLRGLGQPPRTTAEAAEWLRRLGDVSASEMEGPAESLLRELEADQRARRITLPGQHGERWISAEEEALYLSAFSGAATAEAQQAAQTILFRFLQTHALVGLRDVLARYPFEPGWAEQMLHEWARTGKLVTVSGGAHRDVYVSRDPHASPSPSPSSSESAERGEMQWSIPANLEQVQRGTLALLRREVLTCPPQQFADFLLRWQHAHPETRCGASDGLADVLTRLEGLALPADLWEQVVLPTRVAGYQSRWLDERIAAGDWTWVGGESEDRGARSDGERAAHSPLLIAFWQRLHLSELPAGQLGQLDADTQRVLERLGQQGASFLVDLAQDTRLPPQAVRAACWQLVRQGLVTNDQFDVLRRRDNESELRNTAARSAPTAMRSFRASRSTLRAPRSPEGRWSLVRWGQPEAESHAVFRAGLLLNRYGIVAREVALLDADMVPWRILYEVFSRMEMAGEVRRGYFVEGLSGAQFALPEAIPMLQSCAAPSTAAAPLILLHSLDPANLYGAGAPLDIPLLDGGTRTLLQRAGNWLVLKAGRPVLIAEQQGKRLTALPSASREDVTAAVARLPEILTGDARRTGRHRLRVSEWNGQPVTASDGRELLEAAGFVRDYQEMTMYAAWR
jgi:ATP-dependent helicase Lhr and Lhr-like helicase